MPRFLLFRRGRIDQPHQGERTAIAAVREVGVSNLPGAAVVAAAAGFLNPLDDE